MSSKYMVNGQEVNTGSQYANNVLMSDGTTVENTINEVKDNLTKCGKLLWTNPTPTNAINAGTTFQLDESAKDYSFLIIEGACNTSNVGETVYDRSCSIIRKNVNQGVCFGVPLNGIAEGSAREILVTNTELQVLTLSTLTMSSVARNDCGIPLKIYGLF